MTKHQVHGCSNQTEYQTFTLIIQAWERERNCNDTLEIQNTNTLCIHNTVDETNLIPKKHCTPFLKK